MGMMTIVQVIRAELRRNHYELDCYSFRTEGKAHGIATEDCDVAIDFFSPSLITEESFGFLNEIMVKNHFSIKAIEKDPYKEGSTNLYRMKIIC